MTTAEPPGLAEFGPWLAEQRRIGFEERRIEIVLDGAGRDRLAEKGWDPACGAHPLKRVTPHYVQDALAKMILAGEVRDGTTVHISDASEDLTFNGKTPEFADEDEFDMA